MRVYVYQRKGESLPILKWGHLCPVEFLFHTKQIKMLFASYTLDICYGRFFNSENGGTDIKFKSQNRNRGVGNLLDGIA